MKCQMDPLRCPDRKLKMSLGKLVVSCFAMSLFLAFIFWLPSKQEKTVAQHLKNIPAEERVVLEKCWRYVLSQSAFGYTLFGDKPVTHIGYWKPGIKCVDIYSSASFAQVFNPENVLQIRGWEIWEKYQSHFSSENYLFLKTNNFIDNDLETILFINKQAFLKVVHANLSDFRTVLGKAISPELLLEQMRKSDDVFGKVLKNHQGLIGILLGYGRDNAYLFHKEHGTLMKHWHFTLDKLDTIPSGDTWSQHSLQAFNDNQILQLNPIFMNLPCFAANPNSFETKQLKIKYMEQFKRIVHIYEQGEFLEVTLNQMTKKTTDYHESVECSPFRQDH